MAFPKEEKKLKVVEDLGRPKFTLTPNTEWRKVDAEFAQSSLEQAQDYVYNLVLMSGASAKLIAGRFGLDVKAVEKTYGDVIKKAQSELTMLIYADQLAAALESSSASMKQHVGKHFAQQLDQPTITTQDSDGNQIEFEVKLVKVEDKAKNDDNTSEA